eukprot:CAMPEP_0117461108 /NCGR_PEP_ID=MMETSP0784-20121206/2353_1 /TAXON_ID=39447 /ORGANISM="" /LENGTH=105 /DNA_ID=CAMNT_0005254801 /DNA_START=94 /DNA_END=411 /DNA_ORIENTATION=+
MARMEGLYKSRRLPWNWPKTQGSPEDVLRACTNSVSARTPAEPDEDSLRLQPGSKRHWLERLVKWIPQSQAGQDRHSVWYDNVRLSRTKGAPPSVAISLTGPPFI